MAISRWTRTRLQIVAVVAAIAGLCGVTIGWLLSHVEGFVYDFAEIENSARNGLTLGDTLNAAARLEETAKAMNRACLISGDLLRHLRLPAGLAADPLGPVALRGRQRPMDTYALEPAAALMDDSPERDRPRQAASA